MFTSENLLRAFDQHRSLPAQRPAFTELARAEILNADIVQHRVDRGERPLGYKIGFTNRSIWPLYGVTHPIWAPVYDTTVIQLSGEHASVRTVDYIEPRLEPEIVFGLKTAPASAALPDLVAAIDWYAHGFEIVQSIYPDWKFNVAEAFAAQGMHGALLIGARHPLAQLADPVAQLARLKLGLALDGEPKAQGVGANVLDGPIQALAHLVTELSKRDAALRAGDIITTGTLTDAMPLVPGQRWQTVFESVDGQSPPLHGLTLTIA